MDGHQRNLYLYEALNARVLGVSMDDVITNTYFAKTLWLSFPLLSNTLPWMGTAYGAFSNKPPFLPDGTPQWFGRRTVIIDKKGIVRYIRNDSPKFEEILTFLLKLEEEYRGR
jgi:peroxiredoxin Q/BCP